MAKTALIEAQTELAKARAEAEKIDQEYFELSRRIADNQLERTALQRAVQSPNPGQSGEELGVQLGKLQGVIALVEADDARFRALDRDRNSARERIRGLQAEAARLEQSRAAAVQELGYGGQAARLRKEGQDLISRAENLRNQFEHRLAEINKRLEQIGE